MLETIFLIGFAGTGKTTLGTALQKAVSGWRFIDLDHYIENRQGLSVTDIFNRYGEDGFRKFETEALLELTDTSACAAERLVVACGGGTPCFGNNMDTMMQRGLTVWLDSNPERLFERLAEARSKRPLIAELDDNGLREYIRHTMHRRNPYYSRAHLRFDSSRLDDADQIAESVILFTKLIALHDEQSNAS